MKYRWLLRLIACALPAVNLLAAEAPAVSTNSTPAIPAPEPGLADKFPAAFRKTVPTSLADLQAIQDHVKSLVARVSPAVVSVGVGFAQGSAVIISSNGIVLSAAHVSGAPGREATFYFPDGRTARGKTLGTDHARDAGLLQITDPGPWPFVPVSDSSEARIGDWVLALGHPGGFDSARPIVARLGRIVTTAPTLVQSDCVVLSGDSGGPLFDMSGRVIAIHSSISDSTSANFHVPVALYLDSWNRLAAGESWGDRRPSGRRASIGAWGVDDPAGCRLERVSTNGPAASAGLKPGDVITKINDEVIRGATDYFQCLNRIGPGNEANITVRRADAELSVRVTVEARGRRGPPPSR